jgi:hypothetical protein
MKRINLLFMSLLCVWISATAQVGQQSQEPVDSIKNIGYMDSLFQELPEVMITGERPIVKAKRDGIYEYIKDVMPSNKTEEQKLRSLGDLLKVMKAEELIRTDGRNWFIL